MTSRNTPDNKIAFIKGHGTENDFIVLLDPEARVDLDAALVRRLADRRAGLGADGVIRVATAQALMDRGVLEELPADVRAEEWFMDYRNSDGSIAEMCGNGVRVFAHVLAAEELISTDQLATVGVGTRAGRKQVEIHSADQRQAEVSVDMGMPQVAGLSTAKVGDYPVAGLAVDMGNPHLAAVIPGLTAEELAELPVAETVAWDPEFFPAGVNLEVVTPLREGAIHMRVHERGVGETRSCGTGTVAAAVAALADAERETGEVDVHVPGGTVTVTVGEQTSILRGPSALVGRGEAFI